MADWSWVPLNGPWCLQVVLPANEPNDAYDLCMLNVHTRQDSAHRTPEYDWIDEKFFVLLDAIPPV